MHDDEVDIDAALVARLIATQFPDLANLPIRAVRSTGTVNALFRVGAGLYARLPRVPQWAADLDAEWDWPPRLAPHLSLQVPEPVAKGEPASGYRFSRAVYRWIDGEPYADALVDDERRAAEQLAQFVLELRRIDPVAGAPRGGRRPLRELDAVTRAAIGASRGVVDADVATAAWECALEASPFDGDPVWVHTDLLRPNLLVHDSLERLQPGRTGVVPARPRGRRRHVEPRAASPCTMPP